MSPPPRPFGRLDVYVVAFLAALGTVLGVIVVIALWPWHVLAGILLALTGVGVLAARLYFWFQHHRIELVAHRNRAMVLHDSDAGVVYHHDGQVSGYSHMQQQFPSALLPETALSLMGQEPEPAAPEFPHTFSDMVKDGYVHPDMAYVLAFDDQTGEAITMPNLTSEGISGVSGSGKTVSTLSLMLQSIAKYVGHVKFLIADPHMYVDSEEALVAKVRELEPFFLTVEGIRTTVPPDDHDYHALLNRLERLQNPTEGGEELAQWMKLVEMEMKRRLRGKRGEAWVIVMDEFVAIMNDDKTSRPVASVLEQINQQARKFGMYSLLISQEWKATRTGGSELRHSVPGFLIHNTPESIASLIVPADIASSAPRLAVGEVIAFSRGMTRRGRVPLATAHDAERMVELYAPWQPAQVRVTPVEPEPLPPADEVLALPAPIPDEFSIDELTEVRAGYVKGLEVGDIAKQVYGVKSGPELSKAKIKVRKMLAWMVEQTDWQG